MPDSNDDNATSSPNAASVVTDGGIVYRAPKPPRRRLRVAPTIGDVVNTIALETWPMPTACVRLDYSRFAFDSSFPHPSLSTELGAIFALRAPGMTDGEKLAVFGHADPIGEEGYNKTLGGRRAKAIYALLTRQPPLWDELHQGAFQGDKWGVQSLQTCLTQLGYDVGDIDGRAGPLFRAGVHAFKRDHGLADDETMDKETRLALFGSYMDLLTADQGGTARAYDPGDFVGEGKEPDFRGAFQGCGERNLAVVLSKDETNELAPDSKRDELIRTHRPNRRVLIFLFRPADVKKMALWPCPTASAGPDGCASVAWSNKDDRLAPSEERRLISRHGKTFGCKFYDFIARLSPCEAVRVTVNLWLRDGKGQPYPNPVDYELRAGTLVRRGQTDGNGKLIEPEIPVRRDVQVAWLVPDPSSGPSFPPPDPLPALDLSNELDDPSVEPYASGDCGGSSDAADAPPAASNGLASGTTAPSFAHSARVKLPLSDDEESRRNAEWLTNLGYTVSDSTLDTSMARFALDYGLAQNSPPADQSKLLNDVQSTGTVPPSASDAAPEPAPSPSDAQPPDQPAASVRPQCKCDDAPAINWTPADSTLVAVHPAYVPLSKDKLTPDSKGGAGLPADLLFEMPLFDGTFLGQKFSAGRKPLRDPATGIWKRDWSNDEGKLIVTDQVVTGVSPELKERLDWAQKRLWFRYCQDVTAIGKPTSAAGFMAWAKTELNVTGAHSTLRASGKGKGPEISMHADGCAIDVGAGSAPFICVKGKSGDLCGEAHSFPAKELPKAGTPVDPAWPPKQQQAQQRANDELQRKAVASFLPDNVYEPAMAGFDRACLLITGKNADMTVAPGKLLGRPTTAPCDPVTDYTKYAEEDVGGAWDRFSIVNEAWKRYVKPTTLEDFRSTVIDPSPLGATLPIDADLLTYAEANASPPASYAIEIVDVDPAPRKRRRRTEVSIGDLKGNDARARAAFFQMLRDKESAEMVMVKGSLSFGPTAPKTVHRAIPCAWPAGWSVYVPDTRDVTKGFMGVPRKLVVALVEAGLTWLGATGSELGEAISDFTGDIMHFDLRTLHGVGSKELDDWFSGNAARQAWRGTIFDVQRALGQPVSPLSAGNATGANTKLRFVARQAPLLEDPSPIGPILDAATEDANHVGDTDLPTIVSDTQARVAELAAARAKMQSAFLLGGAGGKADGMFVAMGQALKKAYFSTSEEDANKAKSSVEEVAHHVALGFRVITDWTPAITHAKELSKSIAALARTAKTRGTLTTPAERDKLASSLDKLRKQISDISQHANESTA